MALPAGVSTCRVDLRLIKAVVDASDPDRDPDGVPVEGAKVVFRSSLNPAVARVPSATPPTVISVAPITVFTNADGRIVSPDGQLGVYLIASADEDLDPHGWPWQVEITKPDDGISIKTSFVTTPGGEIDLGSVVPVPPNPGTALLQWETAVTAAQEARDEALAAKGSAEDALVAAADAAADAATAAETAQAAAATAVAAALPWLTMTSYTPIEEKLDKWWAAVAAGSAQAVLFGDSIVEGAGASALLNRWQTVAQAAIRSSLGLSGARSPFVPAYSTTNVPHPEVRRYGTVGEYDNAGLGGRTAIIKPTGEVRFTFTGTSCELLYHKASGTGVMRVTLDGGTPLVIDTNSGTNPPAGIPTVWSSGPLTRGQHILSIMRDASSATGQDPYVEGLLTFDGDEDAGVRFLDASRGATDSGYLTVMRTQRMAAAVAAAGGAALAVIAYGTNDYSRSVPLADFRANLERQITELRTAGFDGSVAIVNTYLGGGRDDATWRLYGNQMAAIAAADPDVAYFDLRRRMPDVPTPYTDVKSLGLYADNLHPSDAGHQWIARVMTDYLLPRA